jgi:hypothetical protein
MTGESWTHEEFFIADFEENTTSSTGQIEAKCYGYLKRYTALDFSSYTSIIETIEEVAKV